jgi:hypothetical protein
MTADVTRLADESKLSAEWSSIAETSHPQWAPSA